MTSHAAHTLALIVQKVGVVTLDSAARLAASLDDRGWRYYYTAAERLVAGGFLRRRPTAILGLSRVRAGEPPQGRLRSAPTLRVILTAGPEWGRWSSELGVSETPPLAGHSGQAELAEQLVIGSEVIRLVLDGWRLVHGKDWLDAALALDNGRAVGHRADRLSLLQRTGGLRLPEDCLIAGLLPPTDSGMAKLLVGGQWSPANAVEVAMPLVAQVAPIEVLCWPRSSHYLEHVRAVVGRKLNGRTYSKVTDLPVPSSGKWTEHWQLVGEAVRRPVSGEVRGRLYEFLGLG